MMISHIRLLFVGLGIFCIPTAELVAGITIENDTDDWITIWWMAPGNRKWQKPAISIRAKETQYLDLSDGDYRLYAVQQGKGQDLGWNAFHNNKITYSLAACAPCAEPGAVGPPPKIVSFHVSHAAGTYVCPSCGRVHTRWEAGWTADDSEAIPGDTNDHGVFRPNFDPYGPYRLGVRVMDANGGVVVTEVFDGFPSNDMRRLSDDASGFALTAGINIITHVNGDVVRNASQFSAAVARSPQRLTVRVYNTERHSARDYYTYLR